MKSILVNLLLTILAVGNVQSACSEDVTIKKEGDLKNVKDCSSYSGKITFSNAGISSISLPNLVELEGDFEVSDDKAVSSISLPKLRKVGNIKITKLINLGTLDLSKLTDAQSVVLEELTPLPSISFAAGLKNIGDISISKNKVTKVDGLAFEKAGSIKISANDVLEKLEFTKLTQTDGEVRFEANGQKAEIKAPKLQTVGGDLYYTNSSVFAAPEINEVKGLVHLASCFDKKFEFKKLEKIGKDLTLTTNLKLTEALFPALKSLEEGGLLIVDNKELKSLDLSKLDKVPGGFNIENPSIAKLNISDNIIIDGAVSIFANISCENFQSNFAIHSDGLVNCTNSQGDGSKSIEEAKKGDSSSNKKNTTSFASKSSLTFAAPLLALFTGFYLL